MKSDFDLIGIGIGDKVFLFRGMGLALVAFFLIIYPIPSAFTMRIYVQRSTSTSKHQYRKEKRTIDSQYT